jgi:hypothetical protein
MLDFSTNRTPFLCRNKLTPTQVWSGKVLRNAVNLMGQPYVGFQQRTERHFMSKGPPPSTRGNIVPLETCVALPILFSLELLQLDLQVTTLQRAVVYCVWLTLMGSMKRSKNKRQASSLMYCHQDTGTTPAESERFNLDAWCVILILV